MRRVLVRGTCYTNVIPGTTKATGGKSYHVGKPGRVLRPPPEIHFALGSARNLLRRCVGIRIYRPDEQTSVVLPKELLDFFYFLLTSDWLGEKKEKERMTSGWKIALI